MTRAVALSLKIFTGLICLVDQVTWQKYFATSLGSHSEALPLCLHLPRGTLPWLHAIRHRLHTPGGSKRRHLKGCTIASNLRRDQSGNRRLRPIVFAVLPRRAVQFVARTLGPCGGFAEIKGIEAPSLFGGNSAVARSLNRILAPAFHLSNRNEGDGYAGVRNRCAFRDVQLSMR